MDDLNQVTLLGNVANVDIKSFNNGGKVANISMATNETWKDRETGEKKQKTQWHNVKVTSQNTVEKYVQPYIGKGDRILICGELEYRKYEKDGETKYFTEIVVGPYSGKISKQSKDNRPAASSPGDLNADDDPLDDEVPF